MYTLNLTSTHTSIDCSSHTHTQTHTHRKHPIQLSARVYSLPSVVVIVVSSVYVENWLGDVITLICPLLNQHLLFHTIRSLCYNLYYTVTSRELFIFNDIENISRKFCVRAFICLRKLHNWSHQINSVKFPYKFIEVQKIHEQKKKHERSEEKFIENDSVW